MALVQNGRSLFGANPGVFTGSQGFEKGNYIKGGLRNRFVGGLDSRFGGYNNGALHPNSFIMPQKDGSLSSYTASNGVLTPLANLIPAYNLQGSSAMVLTVTNAQLDQIVSLIASAAGVLSVNTAQLVATVGMTASANGTITVTQALLGAIISAIASSSGTLTPSGTISALGFMEAAAGGPTPLSPEGLAQAVWQALLTDYPDAGTMGKALADAGGAGNPWSSDLTTNNTAGTFGERVQKLLTQSKFLGLKC